MSDAPSAEQSHQKRAFVAGATGFTGRALAHQDIGEHGVDCVLQVRPRSKQRKKLGNDSRIVDVGLSEHTALVDHMSGCDAVMQLIGTVRARFSEAGTYEEVDYNTTLQLLDAAKRAEVAHFILLSSVGAGVGVGSYLAWKKKTEQAVIASGLPYTLVRPGYLAGDETFTERKPVVNTQAFMNGLSDTPVGAAFATLRPINIQLLARVLLRLVRTGPTGGVLTGRGLFRFAREQNLS